MSSIPAEITNEIILESDEKYPSGPRKKFFGLNILIPYYSNYLKFLNKMTSRYGNVVYFEAGSEKIFLINDPGFIEHILITNPDNYLRGTGFSRLRMLLGDGLLSTDGSLHKKHRTMIQPSFHKSSVQGYMDLIDQNITRSISEWDEETSFNIQEKSVDMFIDIIIDLLFGKGDKYELKETVKFFDSLTYDYKAFVLIGLPGVAKKLPLPWAKKFFKLNEKLDEIIYKLIEEAKESDSEKYGILSLLLSTFDRNGDRLSDKEIRDELVTILFAAYDTSARTLTWALYLLTQNPNIHSTFLKMKDVDYSSFADNIVSEALRIYPPAHSITRITDRKDRYADYIIPEGSSVIISPYILHRDEKHFDNSMKFIPERWTAENRKDINRMMYLPFGAGKRSCMGEVFARMQVSMALQRICREFDFSLNGDVKESASLTLKPASGMSLSLKRRTDG